VAGDVRVNEQPMLTVQHTVWVREHNRVASQLRRINPGWRGEKLFQETRRIVIAQWQHIVYNEWLPHLLGTDYMSVFNILPLTEGYSLDYDPDFDPRIHNEFATAAFRFGHTLITPNVVGKDGRGRNVTRIDLKDAFDDTTVVQGNNFLEDTTRGLSRDRVPAHDANFVEDVTNFLFDATGGLDLTALNIQRGREHGIPGYNEYRDRCKSASSNFGKARDFGELTRGGWLTDRQVRRLRDAYRDVDDIDLFLGGTIESAHSKGLVGPTFKCIIGDQFTRLKRGDRFWYEHGDDSQTRFSQAQLRELRKTSLARVMCDNTDIEDAQPLMFLVPAPGNELVSCRDRDIPRVDLEVFRET